MRNSHSHREADSEPTVGTPAGGRTVVATYGLSGDPDETRGRATALLRPNVAVELRRAPAIEAILKGARERRATLIVPSRANTAAADVAGPMFICFDGSEEAGRAVRAAGELLAPRDAIVGSFLEPVDDAALLRTTLPWSPSAETERRLARLDQQEAGFLTQLSAAGTALAGAHGLRARPLSIEGTGSARDALLEAAATAHASCIVVGHRSSATPFESTALELARHADRPVLVVPR
jgi:nucleotide-binding universal stress UspA family protein